MKPTNKVRYTEKALIELSSIADKQTHTIESIDQIGQIKLITLSNGVKVSAYWLENVMSKQQLEELWSYCELLMLSDSVRDDIYNSIMIYAERVGIKTYELDLLND